MRSVYELTFWKISNGHISATSHPIRFMYAQYGHYTLPSDTIRHCRQNDGWRGSYFAMYGSYL